MANPHGITHRLKTMEARIDLAADTINSLTQTVQQLHISMGQMQSDMQVCLAINNSFVDTVYKLQPLGESPAATLRDNIADIETSQLPVATQQRPQPTHQHP